jgi:hypothetical protein
MSRSGQRGKLSRIDFQYLIGTSKGLEHFAEIHELGPFTHAEYMEAFRAEGPDGRSLCIGQKDLG